MSKTKVKRKVIYKRHAGKYTLKDVQKSINIAIEMKKLTKGHLFSAGLKDRCVFCGQSMKTKKQCQYWIMTLFDRIQTILVNPAFFHDDNIQALWLQHGEQYQNIKLPLNVTPEPKSQTSASEKVEHE